MSYILDALRRADAERERDPGRGIHAQPVPLPAETARRTPLWIAAAVAALLVVVGVALLLRPAPRVSQDLGMPPPNAPTMIRQAPAPHPVVPVAAAQASPPVVAAEVSPPAPAPLPAPAAPAPAAERVPERPVVKAPAVAAAPARPAPSAPVAVPPAPAAVAAPAAVPPPAPAAPAAERVLAFGELPPEVQRELPKLQISGGVHSENPAQRMLVVGGQVVGEGAEAAPGVLVEQIRPKSAVLKFRNYRYSVQY